MNIKFLGILTSQLFFANLVNVQYSLKTINNRRIIITVKLFIDCNFFDHIVKQSILLLIVLSLKIKSENY
jgi:hypothetical protein